MTKEWQTLDITERLYKYDCLQNCTVIQRNLPDSIELEVFDCEFKNVFKEIIEGVIPEQFVQIAYAPYSSFKQRAVLTRDNEIMVYQQQNRKLLISQRSFFKRQEIQALFWIKQQYLFVVYAKEVILYKVLFPVKDLEPIIDQEYDLSICGEFEDYQLVNDQIILVYSEDKYLVRFDGGQLLQLLVPSCETVLGYFHLKSTKAELQLYDNDEDFNISSSTIRFDFFSIETDSEINNETILILLNNEQILFFLPQQARYVGFIELPTADFDKIFVENDLLFALSLKDKQELAYDLVDYRGNFPYQILNNTDEAELITIDEFIPLNSCIREEVPQIFDTENSKFHYPYIVYNNVLYLIIKNPKYLLEELYFYPSLHYLNKCLNFAYYRSMEFVQPFLDLFAEYLKEEQEIFPVLKALICASIEVQICRTNKLEELPEVSDESEPAQLMTIEIVESQEKLYYSFAGKKIAFPKIFSLELQQVIDLIQQVENKIYKKYCIIEVFTILKEISLHANTKILTFYKEFSIEELYQLTILQILPENQTLGSLLIKSDDEDIHSLGLSVLDSETT